MVSMMYISLNCVLFNLKYICIMSESMSEFNSNKGKTKSGDGVGGGTGMGMGTGIGTMMGMENFFNVILI